MRLTIELVPETSWYNNVRKIVSKEDWDKIRRKAYADYGHKCGICNASGMLHCHERWEYDDATHTQYLRGFIALCPMCHYCKHIGFAGILADEGKLDYSELEKHFCKVNNCSQDKMDEEVREAFELWDERSNHAWTVNFGQYESIIQRENL